MINKQIINIFIKFKHLVIHLKFAYLLIGLFTCLLIFAFVAPAAHAQSVDLGIYPPIFEVTLTPPANIKAPFTLINYTDEAVDLNLSLKPFTASTDENGQIVFTEYSDLPDPFIFSKIIVLDKNTPINSITLAPKQQKDFVLEFKIPGNQQKGDYYLALVFSSNAKNINTTTSSGASAGIASNILLSVGPQGKTQGILEAFSSPFFVSKGPVPFNVRLRNTSNHFITPKGDIIIKNVFGQAVGKVNLLPVNVLSNTIRRLPDSLQSSTAKNPDNLNSYFLSLKSPQAVWPEKFLLGPYKAILTLSLSENGPVFRKEAFFFAFPAEYLMAILIIIGIVVFIVMRVKKRI